MLKIEELFDDWVEFDVAQYYLACLLSLTTYDPSGGFARMKGPFSWKSEFGTMCYEILEKMTNADFCLKEMKSEDIGGTNLLMLIG